MKKTKIILLTTLTALALTACGKKTETTVETTEVPTEIITVTFNKDIINIFDVDAETYWNMSIDDFENSVDEYIDDYRSFFKIGEDYTLTDADWSSLKEVFGTQIRGFLLPEDIEEESTTEVETDENWKYESPMADDIDAMTIDEFVEYLKGYDAYNGYEEVDYTELTEEELQEIKDEYVADLRAIEENTYSVY